MMQSLLAPSWSNMLSDIVCDEAGTPNASYWAGSVESVGSDYESIVSHANSKTIRIEERHGRLEVHGRDRVGVIGLPSGRRIVINTKIPGIVLLDWLVYLREFPDLQLWDSGGSVDQSDSWQKVLVRLFLRELEMVTRCHLRKGYVTMEVVLCSWPHSDEAVIAATVAIASDSANCPGPQSEHASESDAGRGTR